MFGLDAIRHRTARMPKKCDKTRSRRANLVLAMMRAALLMSLAVFAACSDSELVDPCAATGDNGVVATGEGSVLGHADHGACAFWGLRYAAPPVAESRFRPPSPAPTHDLVDARAFGPACSQIDLAGTTSGDEDCLHLNVWTEGAIAPPRPVLVFFHGGGNVFGSSLEPTYAGARLAKLGHLVVVTLDYRLGALGYLAHPALSREQNPPSSGNQGLLDQLSALAWVHDNVAAFGGDPDRIMIFGQSAGARTVCALLGSSLARGLFASAWIQSGTCDYPLLSSREILGRTLAESLGCTDDATVAACLRAVGSESFLRVAPGYPTLLDGSPYNPNIDGAVLVENPLDTFGGSDPPEMPVVVASNADEVAEVVDDVASDDYPAAVQAIFGDLAPSILPRYPLSQYASPRAALIRIITDARYTCPLTRTARRLGQRSRGAVFRALFSYGLPAGPDGARAAFHGVELRFLFQSFDQLGVSATAEEIALSNELIARISALARFGDPNVPAAAGWPTFGPGSERYLKLDAPSAAAENLQAASCDFWDSL
jgi:para-nitrobenzyl esterase